MPSPLKRYWVWSDGKWCGRLRDRSQAELSAYRLAEQTGDLSAVIRVGLLRFRFIAGFPKEHEQDLREYFHSYLGKVSDQMQREMPWPPLP